jgi:glycosyltransferase involved in cell wall biosynthesis
MKLQTFIKNAASRETWPGMILRLLARLINMNIDKVYVAGWQKARKKRPWIPGSKEFNMGINLVGFLRTAKGIAEAARSNLLAIKTAKIAYSVIDYEVGIPVDQLTEAFPDPEFSGEFRFNTNLIHINPPQLPRLWKLFEKNQLIGRYTIGVWYWELPGFPEEWRFAFSLVDEIWVASKFVQDAIQSKSPVPVVKIPPCIHVESDSALTRNDFNLPESTFLFLCAYDAHSITERKNPLAAIRAFKKGFRENDDSVGLVIKIRNSSSDSWAINQIKHELQGNRNFYLIEESFPKIKFNSLLNLVDAYVSLHRSEGFGLIPAEAMSFGKPVIMTSWSGTLDLMTVDNSCGVEYKLIPVKEKIGPYIPGQIWADPDIEQAAYLMNKLTSDRFFYNTISTNARATIARDFSPEKTGEIIKNRLLEIYG